MLLWHWNTVKTTESCLDSQQAKNCSTEVFAYDQTKLWLGKPAGKMVHYWSLHSHFIICNNKYALLYILYNISQLIKQMIYT